VLLVAALVLPVLAACGGGGTDFVAQPQELAVIEDCANASVYADRIVAGLWNRLCPADTVPTPGVQVNLATGEFDIRTTVRGRNLHAFGFIKSSLSLLNGLQRDDTASVDVTILTDKGSGQGKFYLTPDAKHSLRVTGHFDFENERCDIAVNSIEFRGWAAGTTVRLWGRLEFDTREHKTGDRIEGIVQFIETELEDEPVAPRLEAYRYHGSGPLAELTQYERHYSPDLYDIFG
jgi:hypothetical protein